MIRSILVFILFTTTLAGISLAQDKPFPAFPRDFTGHWKGTLYWYPPGKPSKTVEMQLIIQPLDTPGCYQWQMVYGSPGEDNRGYTLKPVDSTSGHWVVDENNGILLDGYWLGGRFTSIFSVQGSVITEVLWLENGALQIEFITHAEKTVRESGGTDANIPAARSFPVRGYQRATLRRTKK